MKGMLYSFSGLMLAVLLFRETSCETKVKDAGLIPLAIGNTWIYLDSVYEEGKLSKVYMDTDRVVKTGKYENFTTYIFNDGDEVMVKGDTLFELVSQRSGMKFPTIMFLPSETKLEYNYAFGGDVVTQRTVMPAESCPEAISKISRCYTVTDACRSQSIFATGIGFIYEKNTDCFKTDQNYWVRTLIAAEINGKKIEIR